jgi:serine/threonine protein kinase
VGPNPKSVFLVFEYCEHDIACNECSPQCKACLVTHFAGIALVDTVKAPFSESAVKRLTMQLLAAVSFLHSSVCARVCW